MVSEAGGSLPAGGLMSREGGDVRAASGPGGKRAISFSMSRSFLYERGEIVLYVCLFYFEKVNYAKFPFLMCTKMSVNSPELSAHFLEGIR